MKYGTFLSFLQQIILFFHCFIYMKWMKYVYSTLNMLLNFNFQRWTMSNWLDPPGMIQKTCWAEINHAKWFRNALHKVANHFRRSFYNYIHIYDLVNSFNDLYFCNLKLTKKICLLDKAMKTLEQIREQRIWFTFWMCVIFVMRLLKIKYFLNKQNNS